jgi:DNA polymerase-1
MTEIPFAEVWVCDFEFQAPRGERPTPLCMVAHEVKTGRAIHMWREQLFATPRPPFNIGRDAVMVAYSAHAELQCFKAIEWQFPHNVIDLYPEHLVSVNGWELSRSVLPNRSMLSAMAFRGISSMEGARKDAMRRLIMERDRWSAAEQQDIDGYCDDDVTSSERLLDYMTDYIDWPAALLRGRYSGALANMEWTGVPLDVDLYQRLSTNWSALKEKLITAVDVDYNIYDGTTFKRSKFIEYLQSNKIPWPRLPSGALALDGDTFKDQARSFPALNPLRELISTIAKLRLTDLTVGSDGRNRVYLNPYGSVTGRNQPGASEFIFGPAVWLRGLIRPGPGCGIAYCDWTAQEVAIAGALSGDEQLIEDYCSGDIYITFAVGAGLAPLGATKETHREVRDLCKILFLATNYGQTARGLAMRLRISVTEAAHLLELHKARYRVFTAWSQRMVDSALLGGEMATKYGWRRAVRERAATNGRALQNWPIQAAGGEMLRIACIAATEAGISVCCPVHDALLVEGSVDQIEEIAAATCRIMERAGQAVTGGLVVRAESKIIRWPDRYSDPRGTGVWGKAMSALADLEEEALSSARNNNCLDGEFALARETCAEHIGGLGDIGGSKGIRGKTDIRDNKEREVSNINISPRARTRTRARASRDAATIGSTWSAISTWS